ncbi:MAG: deoxyribonuclease IV [Bacilli bacterium]|nr:deoxyribonuclease IV [Bacilli bacterium]
MKLKIGSHVSFTKKGGLKQSTNEAIQYNATTFMFYTGAPQNTVRTPIDNENTNQAKQLMKKNGIEINDVIIHAPYIINLANNKDESRFNFAVNFLKEELKRAKQLGISKVVLHPGSHVGLGEETGIKNIIKGLNLVIEDESPTICLETMAGKGTELGCTFEQIKAIIDGVEKKEHIMVCLDTCHLNDAGYDLNNFEQLLNKFDQIIGIEKIGCIHINDSKNPISSHKDRHENIGFGTIGFKTLIDIIYNPKLEKVSKILETPYINGYPPYKFEIEMIKNKTYNKNLAEEVVEFYK